MIRNLLILAVMAASSFFLCSYQGGAATVGGWDCTGAESGLQNPTGCSNGGCHGNTATTGITVTLEIDSAGAPVTAYKAGLTYTIKLTGTNTTSANLPKFGFQVASIAGSAAQVTPTNAGTFQQTGLPAGVQIAPVVPSYYVCNIIEHSTPLSPSSGTGGNGTVYSTSFTWTAPVQGTGTVSFWAALNAVNHDGSASSADKWNVKHVVLQEDTVTTVTSIDEPAGNMTISVYPNPSTDAVQIDLYNAMHGAYNMSVFDVDGNAVLSRIVEVSDNFSKTTLNTTGWSAGIYFVQIVNDGLQKVVKIVKR